jgi:hypothetical protein
MKQREKRERETLALIDPAEAANCLQVKSSSKL